MKQGCMSTKKLLMPKAEQLGVHILAIWEACFYQKQAALYSCHNHNIMCMLLQARGSLHSYSIEVAIFTTISSTSWELTPGSLIYLGTYIIPSLARPPMTINIVQLQCIIYQGTRLRVARLAWVLGSLAWAMIWLAPFTQAFNEAIVAHSSTFQHINRPR